MKLRLDRDLKKFEQGEFTIKDLEKYWGLTPEQIEHIAFSERLPDEQMRKDFVIDSLKAFISDRVNQVTKLPDKRMMYIRLNNAIRVLFDEQASRDKIIDYFKKANEIIQNSQLDEKIRTDELYSLRREMIGDTDITVIAGDLSNFKMVNDVLSHRDGDVALNVVARELLDVSAKISQNGNFTSTTHSGGDEFVVLSEANVKNNEDVLQKLQNINNVLGHVFSDDEISEIKNEEVRSSEALKVIMKKQFGLSLHIDFGMAHISEGLTLLLEMCNNRQLISSEYCSYLRAEPNEWFLTMEKQVANLTHDIADRRALINKNVNKLRTLEGLDDLVQFKTYLMQLVSRGFEKKATLLSFIETLRKLDPNDREATIKSKAIEIMHRERKQKRKVEDGVHDLLDKYAILAL